MRTVNGLKHISVAALIEILSALPQDSTIIPNTVGNLIVSNATCNAFDGWIDIGEQIYHSNKAEEAEEP